MPAPASPWHPAAVHVCRSRSNPPPLQLYQCTLILIPVDFLQLYNMAIRGSDWKTSPATNVLVQVRCVLLGVRVQCGHWGWGGGGRLHRSLAAIDWKMSPAINVLVQVQCGAVGCEGLMSNMEPLGSCSNSASTACSRGRHVGTGFGGLACTGASGVPRHAVRQACLVPEAGLFSDRLLCAGTHGSLETELDPSYYCPFALVVAGRKRPTCPLSCL